MQTELKKRGTFNQGIFSLMKLRDELWNTILSLKNELSSDEFNAIPFINAEGYHSKTIAYSLWHVFRIEDILAIWYRDALMFKATADANNLIFRDEMKFIKMTASRSTYEGLEIILKALDKAKARLSANVSFDLTMELLLLTIKENSNN